MCVNMLMYDKLSAPDMQGCDDERRNDFKYMYNAHVYYDIHWTLKP